MTQKIILYVGTYTRPTDFLLNTHGEGIYIFEFNATTGELTQTQISRQLTYKE